ncbi:hypothetical protein AB1N83_013664 [Pleurotus pulmonarius]
MQQPIPIPNPANGECRETHSGERGLKITLKPNARELAFETDSIRFLVCVSVDQRPQRVNNDGPDYSHLQHLTFDATAMPKRRYRYFVISSKRILRQPSHTVDRRSRDDAAPVTGSTAVVRRRRAKRCTLRSPFNYLIRCPLIRSQDISLANATHYLPAAVVITYLLTHLETSYYIPNVK